MSNDHLKGQRLKHEGKLTAPYTPAITPRKPISGRSAYAYCARATRAASTSFYYAFQTLPRAKRNAIYAVYTFCRQCDDIVEIPSANVDAGKLLDTFQADLNAAFTGAPNGPLWAALHDVRLRFGITQRHLVDVIDGCRMDLAKQRYATFAELEQYCLRVASAVGLAVIEVCGYGDKRAEKHAVDLGLAMQLTNIIRDVGEDARAGRVYLPLDELARFGVQVDSLSGGPASDQFVDLMKYQADRARRYFASGALLLPYLDRRSRICPEAMHDVYLRTLDRIEKSDFDVRARRIGISKREKLALAAKFWIRSRVPFA